MTIWVFIVILLGLPASVQAQTILPTYKLIKVIDGDTITVEHEGKWLTVNLKGIDAPEIAHTATARKQAKEMGLDMDSLSQMGAEAKDFTTRLLRGKTVVLVPEGAVPSETDSLTAYVYIPAVGIPKYVLRRWELNHDRLWKERGLYEQPAPRMGYELNVNAFLVLSGYARPAVKSTDEKYAQLFSESYQYAVKNQKGLWDTDCQVKKDCRYLDCTIFDNSIKSGYQSDCVDGFCKCMCYGCH